MYYESLRHFNKQDFWKSVSAQSHSPTFETDLDEVRNYKTVLRSWEVQDANPILISLGTKIPGSLQVFADRRSGLESGPWCQNYAESV